MAVAESRRHLSEPAASADGLALVAITALVKNVLENGLAKRGVSSQIGGDAMVSALPPDRVASAGDEKAQLHLFLYMVTPHTVLRLDGDRSRQPTLAFDLHYIVTAYGAQDYQAELLLGCAMQVLHDTAVLERSAVRDILAALTSKGDRRVVPAPLAALAGWDFGDHVQRITIMPEFLPNEEMSRLWSAMQTKLRLSATYKVSAVPVTGSTAR
jgi:uncharacterized protein DUF4255